MGNCTGNPRIRAGEGKSPCRFHQGLDLGGHPSIVSLAGEDLNSSRFSTKKIIWEAGGLLNNEGTIVNRGEKDFRLPLCPFIYSFFVYSKSHLNQSWLGGTI